MSTDISSQEYLIDDLPTTSVTIYPSRAHVVRDITDVKLRPGLNEVTIYGITPAADEHSVQIDGHGAATITDMSVELIPNRERFADQFPDDESDSDFTDFDDDDFKSPDLKLLRDQVKQLRAQAEAEEEKKRSANDQLRVLNAFIESLNAKHNELDSGFDAITSYGSNRARIHAQWVHATNEIERLRKMITKKEAKLSKEAKEERKIKKKEREENQKKKALRQREARRIREEKAKFWPKKVYCVKVSLEVADTPTSSRRTSLDSLSADLALNEKVPMDDSNEKTARLSLSYVVREVSWSPRYNVNISSLKKAATITYSAEFSNKTSETWKDAKITLSTSQTSYSGLDDTVPELRPWPIFLRDKHTFGSEDDGVTGFWDTKFSPQENLSGGNFNSFKPGRDIFNRFEFFGPEISGGLFGQARNLSEHQPAQAHAAFGRPGFGSQPATTAGAFNTTGAGFGNNNVAQGTDSTNTAPIQPRTGGLFGGNNNNNNAQQTGGGLFGSSNNAQQAQGSALFGNSNNNNSSNAHASSLFGGSGNNPAQQQSSSAFGAAFPPPPLQHQETTWEDSGMTTAYELPSTRTLAPSSLSRRQKLTTISIPHIDLSYITIPKLRKGAFLRAKLRNPAAADVILLKGAAGLTLDGSFLGNASLPRTSPGEHLELDLGVDPAIHIAYAPPSLSRSTQGLINRENAELYSRSICITNTRAAPVSVTVLDQVPISEQERLRVDIWEPRGLVKGGGKVKAGQAAAGKEGAGKWGEATAELKDGAEVEWTVQLEKGKSCTLPLEWEVRLPMDKKIAFA
ncbi:putative mucoidy inhibitor-like protein [Neofusicoccum parvum]|uniref:Mucoidy inhibitor-like protein n=1 Tax=Neofusicoccum parvum TaxID=310453 RepID=A0ACB5S4M8_9PEZI|nr:putative mucoidy inhibitor-like protein [Neofusicoccum parvum]